MSLKNAFKFVIYLQGRDITYYDPETDTSATVKAAPANFFRNFQGFEQMPVEGREWVILKDDLDALAFSAPARNQRIDDADMGQDTISVIKEMVILGEIVAYRLRSE